jgi:hypothetical protein
MSNQIQQHIRKIIQHDQVRFIPRIQGLFKVSKTISVIQQINRSKGKKPLDYHNRCRKSLQQDPTPLVRKLGIEAMYLNIVKAVYDKSTANIILNGEKLKLFPLKSGMRQESPLSLLLFNVVLEFLA